MHDDFYQMYLEEMEAIPPCSKEELLELLREAALNNKEAKKRIVEGNLKQVLGYAKEFEGQGVLLTDLVQEANMALLMAVEEFSGEIDRDEFESFIKEKVKEALGLVVEEQKSSDQTGEELAARVNVLQQVSQILAGELGREATVEELAEKMKMSVEEIQGIMKMTMDAMSLNAENADLETLAGAEGIEIIEAGTEDEE